MTDLTDMSETELRQFADQDTATEGLKLLHYRQAFDEMARRLRELERENKVLQIKATASLANNLCPDHRDKQNGKPCLACAVEQAESTLLACQADLIARVRLAYESGYGKGHDDTVEGAYSPEQSVDDYMAEALSHSTGSKIMAVVEAAKEWADSDSLIATASARRLYEAVRALEAKHD